MVAFDMVEEKLQRMAKARNLDITVDYEGGITAIR
jgi:hypothetical protein